jgi:hypothetical protein
MRRLQNIMAGALALAIFFMTGAGVSVAQAQAEMAVPAKPDPNKVSGPEISILIRTILVAVHQANVTGNYTVLRDLGAQSFRNINSPVRLGTIFATIREAGLDLGQTVLFDPKLMKKAVIDGNGLLVVEGYFPTKPLNVVFKLAFRFEDKGWKLFSIALGAQPPEKVGQIFATDPAKKKPASPDKKAQPANKKAPEKKKKSQSVTQ